MNAELLSWLEIVRATALLVVANGAPVLAARVCSGCWAHPVDAGLMLGDRQPLFGYAKTWRGIIAAILLCTLLAPLLELPWQLGGSFGFWSMAGDLLASGLKRRFGCPVSSRARLLDTLPEAALPLAVLQAPLHLGLADVVAATGIFAVLEVLFSPLLFRLHIRKRPY